MNQDHTLTTPSGSERPLRSLHPTDPVRRGALEPTRRVVVLNQYALPRDQAGGTRHVDLFGRLAKWEPVIIAGNRNYSSQQEFETPDSRFRLVSVSRSDGRLRHRLVTWTQYCLGALREALRVPNAAVVVASSPQMFVPFIGWLVSRVRRIPFVVEVRDLWPESLVAAGALKRGSLSHRILEHLEHWYYDQAHAIITVTDGWADYFTEIGHREKVSLIPNGADALPPPDPDSRSAARQKYEISGFAAIFAGSHGPKDGLAYVISAAEQCPELSFLLVGDGPDRQSAIRMAAELRLENVRFIDPVPKCELVEMLQACDAGIHAVTPLSVFQRGMSPNKLFDYLAAGLPVVSNAGTAVANIFEQNSCGYFGSPDSIPDLLRKIAGASTASRSRWSQTAREIMEGSFSRDASARKLALLLDSVAQTKHTVGRAGLRTSRHDTQHTQQIMGD